MRTEDMYYNEQKRSEVMEAARRLRRKFLRYQQAEIVYSLSHKKLMELANAAGAIYRMDGIVLINRDIFDEYLERFHETKDAFPMEEDYKIDRRYAYVLDTRIYSSICRFEKPLQRDFKTMRRK